LVALVPGGTLGVRSAGQLHRPPPMGQLQMGGLCNAALRSNLDSTVTPVDSFNVAHGRVTPHLRTFDIPSDSFPLDYEGDVTPPSLSDIEPCVEVPDCDTHSAPLAAEAEPQHATLSACPTAGAALIFLLRVD
jgi:hypothetical protein